MGPWTLCFLVAIATASGVSRMDRGSGGDSSFIGFQKGPHQHVKRLVASTIWGQSKAFVETWGPRILGSKQLDQLE